MSYEVIFDEMRTSKKDGVRYAKVRAIANGVDSYNSIFTENARKSLIEQIKLNGVQSGAQHKNTIISNIKKYLMAKYEKAFGSEKEDLIELIGNIPNIDFPIGKVIDAYFVDDNVVEAIIQENSELKLLGKEQADFLEGTWNMIETGVLSGVSLVFNDLKTTMSGEKMFIDDVNIRGLDFVDRPSHKDTRVIETFMRAMQDTTHLKTDIHQEGLDKTRASEEKIMANEENNKAPVVDVDELVNKATQKIEEKKLAEEKAKQELSDKEEAIRKEYEDKIAEAKAESDRLKAEKEEAEKLAEEAIKIAEKKVVRTDNPYAQRAEESAKANQDPLAGKSLRELVGLKYNKQ